MRRSLVIVAALLIAASVAAALYWRESHREVYFTGFVEGEERVIRSEVTGRVLEVRFAEGERVPANAVVAVLDAADIDSRIAAKRKELGLLAAQIATQQERVQLAGSTWKRDVAARSAELRRAEAAARLAERNLRREKELVATGASTAQRLDDARTRRDEAQSALVRARELLGRARAEKRAIAVARGELRALRRRRELAEAELAELGVRRSKYTIRAPAVPTVVQTQFVWPGELAQPGTAILSVLDPRDKYVRIYIPVPELGRVHIGQRVEIELDSEPGRRVPGEVSFIADKATFTPEKIETREDRIGQVYRAKVRILEGVERFKPGTEGNVYLVADESADSEPG